jgi:hypothetical protein
MIRPRTLVLAAIAVVVLLAGTLGVRSLNRGHTAPSKPAPARLTRYAEAVPAASLPGPGSIDALKVPCWGCPEADGWPIAYRTDLDLLAPLGKGAGNAALWLKDFSKQVGAREDEAEQAAKRRVEGPGDYGKVLSGDDPLLVEALPWADQAVMRFYPDVYPMEGFETRLPNLLFALTVGKSWAARAAVHPDAPTAPDDCRRAIRWGRLLRQDDTTLIQDLIGLACIRLGTEQLYAIAVRRGDHQLALASAIVLGEHAPQRLRTAHLMTRLDLTSSRGIDVTDRKLDAVIEAARSSKDRRFRLEGIYKLAVVRAVGSRQQRQAAETALDELTGSPDPLLSAAARWARTTELSRQDLAGAGFPFSS